MRCWGSLFRDLRGAALGLLADRAAVPGGLAGTDAAGDHDLEAGAGSLRAARDMRVTIRDFEFELIAGPFAIAYEFRVAVRHLRGVGTRRNPRRASGFQDTRGDMLPRGCDGGLGSCAGGYFS